jgi:hypothetical protein
MSRERPGSRGSASAGPRPAVLARLAALTGLVALVGLAGCAAPGQPGASGAATGSPVASATSSGADMVGMPDPSGGKVSAAPVTLRGVVTDGVEAGCVVLNAEDGKQYLLLGGDPAVVIEGGRVEVTGFLQPDLMTYCQQGVPFSVRTAHRI